jgi:hypothetical protein
MEQWRAVRLSERAVGGDVEAGILWLRRNFGEAAVEELRQEVVRALRKRLWGEA